MRAVLGVLGYVLGRLGQFLRYRVGVRGLAMLICAYIWSLFGFGAFFDLTRPYEHTFHQKIPSVIRGIAWTLSSLVAVWGCWIRNRKGRTADDRWHDERPAFVALGVLVVMPVIHMASFVGAFIDGNHIAWYGGSFYLAATTLVALAAFIPVPRVPTPTAAPPREDHHP